MASMESSTGTEEAVHRRPHAPGPQASAAMAREDVTLELDLGLGTSEAVVLTSDLGYRYVEVNAEYTT